MFKFHSEEHPNLATTFKYLFEVGRERKALHNNLPKEKLKLELDNLQCGPYMLSSDPTTLEQYQKLKKDLELQVKDLTDAILISNEMIRHNIKIISNEEVVHTGPKLVKQPINLDPKLYGECVYCKAGYEEFQSKLTLRQDHATSYCYSAKCQNCNKTVDFYEKGN